MTPEDVSYIAMRLGLKPEQPSTQALHRVYVSGVPLGPAARTYSIPFHKLHALHTAAEEIRARFAVSADEADALGVSVADAERVMAYYRAREVAGVARSAKAAALKAAGLTDDEIAAILK